MSRTNGNGQMERSRRNGDADASAHSEKSFVTGTQETTAGRQL